MSITSLDLYGRIRRFCWLIFWLSCGYTKQLSACWSQCVRFSRISNLGLRSAFLLVPHAGSIGTLQAHAFIWWFLLQHRPFLWRKLLFQHHPSGHKEMSFTCSTARAVMFHLTQHHAFSSFRITSTIFQLLLVWVSNIFFCGIDLIGSASVCVFLFYGFVVSCFKREPICDVL
ncbi:uncharacterized protein LOC104903542 isoform X1 [Beta vulgaris subsp. vulgaris]|uniref:uncharacterized protein LOC104903542 isoform X1 n=1 Tax=Beta vulgaris subsp. vulgaris TaxID=3555 RepID=UPI0020375B1F|nr:uncharacterized protein LOC104903542 isoform X1 [Beta vulgaris subsp. vulgaris]